MITGVDILRHVPDILLCTLVLRVIIGWLIAYPRLLNLLYFAAAFGLLAAVVIWFRLPFAMLLGAPLLLLVALALLLSFLPELTRLYRAAARGNLFRPRVFQSEEMVREMANALWDLSKSRCGALFVIPRQFEVESLVSGGEDVDVRLNRSMILSIFNTHSPRHDGAAIVRRGKIVRVGAVLPLATAEGADTELGTRHLAALGLTQRCDAVVLVVSESRGVVSYVSDGTIKPLIADSAEEMESRLLELLGIKTQEKNRRRHRLLSGITWAVALLLSIVGSFAMEQYNILSLQDTKFVSVEARVEFVNLPDNLYITNMPTKPVSLNLRLPRKENIDGRNLTVRPDLSRAISGVRTFTLTDNMVHNLPAGAVVNHFDPSEITIKLEKPRALEAPVQMPNVYGLPEHLRVTELRLQPETVKVLVRDSAWKYDTALQAFPVDLSGITKPGEYERHVRLNLPPSVQPADGEPGVRIFFRAEERQETK